LSRTTAHTGHHLQRLAALDQNAVPGSPGEPGDERDRDSQYERAWRCNDEHCNGPDRIAGQKPCRSSHGDGDEKKTHRIAIGEAGHRGPGTLRLLDEPDDARESALRSTADRRQVEGIAGIRRSAHHGLADRALNRQRLAGQGGFVQDRNAGRDRAVDRHDISPAYEQTVARSDGLQRHLFETVVAMSNGRAWNAREKSRHLPPRPSLSEAFQVLATRIHQRDHDCREFLAEHERCRHRECGDDVEPEISPPQARHDLCKEDEQHGNRSQRPDCGRQSIIAQKSRHEPGNKSKCRNADENRSDTFLQGLKDHNLLIV
jgi:hypothetical protein